MTDWRICHVCKTHVDVLIQKVFEYEFYYYVCDTCDEIYAMTRYGDWVESGCVMEWYSKGNTPEWYKTRYGTNQKGSENGKKDQHNSA